MERRAVSQRVPDAPLQLLEVDRPGRVVPQALSERDTMGSLNELLQQLSELHDLQLAALLQLGPEVFEELQDGCEE